jgi:hypothetical protein
MGDCANNSLNQGYKSLRDYACRLVRSLNNRPQPICVGQSVIGSGKSEQWG